MTAERPAKDRATGPLCKKALIRHLRVRCRRPDLTVSLSRVALLIGLALLPGCLPVTQEQHPEAQNANVVPAASENAPLQRALIEQVQSHLVALGYKPGVPDGVPGQQTAAAIEAYQQDQNLPVDGRVTAGLLADLEAGLAKAAVPYAKAVSPVKTPAHAPKPKPETLVMAQPPAEAMPPPRYLPGARYLYANGEMQEVLAVEGEEVRWRSNRGETSLRNRNFMLPPLSWSDGEAKGRSRFDISPDEIWQQNRTGQTAFNVTIKIWDAGKIRDGAGPESVVDPESVVEKQEHWRCRLGDAATVTVIAGSFETFGIVCERLAADGTPELERSWSYAPSLGHFVRRQDRVLKGQHELIETPLVPASTLDLAPTLELVAIQPAYLDWPPAALGGLKRAVRHVLDEMPAGEPLDWRSSAVKGEVSITAGEPFAMNGQSNCRRLEQTWTHEDETWRFPSLACRLSNDDWQFQDNPGQSSGQGFAESLTPVNKQAASFD